MHPDCVVAGHIDHTAEVKDRVKDRQGFIARHIDLVQYAETALNRTLTDRAGAEYDLPVPERIGSDHIRCVHIDMK